MIRKAGRLSMIGVIFSRFTVWVIRTNSDPSYLMVVHLTPPTRLHAKCFDDAWIFKAWPSMTSNNLILTRSKATRPFLNTFGRVLENFPSLSQRALWAVCQIHRLKYSDKWGSHYQLVQHSFVPQPCLPGDVVTCDPSYLAFFRPSILTCPYLGPNTTHNPHHGSKKTSACTGQKRKNECFKSL